MQGQYLFNGEVVLTNITYLAEVGSKYDNDSAHLKVGLAVPIHSHPEFIYSNILTTKPLITNRFSPTSVAGSLLKHTKQKTPPTSFLHIVHDQQVIKLQQLSLPHASQALQELSAMFHSTCLKHNTLMVKEEREQEWSRSSLSYLTIAADTSSVGGSRVA